MTNNITNKKITEMEDMKVKLSVTVLCAQIMLPKVDRKPKLSLKSKNSGTIKNSKNLFPFEDWKGLYLMFRLGFLNNRKMI